MIVENHKPAEQLPDEDKTPVVSLAPTPAHPQKVKLETRQDKMDFARRAIEAQEKEGITFRNFARAYGVDYNIVHYYTQEYRKAMGLEPRRKRRSPGKKPLNYGKQPSLPTISERKEVVQLTNDDKTKQLEDQVANLTQLLDDANDKLREARATVKSLQKVVIILGHQHDAEDE